MMNEVSKKEVDPPKILDLEYQPPREEVLPFINLLGNRERGVFSDKVLDSIEVVLSILRDPKTDPDTFRFHLEYLTALELQAMLMPRASEVWVETPLGVEIEGRQWETNVALFYICRAGLTMGLAAARFIPNAPIGEFKIHRDEKTLEAVLEGYDLPPAKAMIGKTIMILDPMNATGGSIVEAGKVINEVYLSRGVQVSSRILVGNIVSAPLGVKELLDQISGVDITTVALDDRLTSANHPDFPPGYIIPGLGDAGDRSFGEGLSEIYKYYDGMLKRLPSYQTLGRIIA